MQELKRPAVVHTLGLERVVNGSVAKGLQPEESPSTLASSVCFVPRVRPIEGTKVGVVEADAVIVNLKVLDRLRLFLLRRSEHPGRLIVETGW